jgi:hypothetical protein
LRLPGWCRPSADVAFQRLLVLDWAATLALTVTCCAHAVLSPRPGGGTPADGARQYWLSAHLAVASRWVFSQLPLARMVLPEALRCAVGVAALLACLQQSGGLTLGDAAGVAARGALCALAVPLLHGVCQDAREMPGVQQHLPPPLLRRSPAWSARAVEACVRAVESARDALGPDGLVRMDAATLLTSQLGVCAACVWGLRVTDVLAVGRTHNALFALACCAGSAFRLQTASLGLLQKRLGVGGAPGGAMRALAARLREAVSEQDVLRVASEALHAYFPAATAQAIATLTPDGVVATLDVAALDISERLGLQNALPRALPPAAGEAGAPGADTAVAFVCGAARAPATRGAVVADSADWPEGTHAFHDWQRATEEGVTAAQLVTASLVSRTTVVGFVVLNFRTLGGFARARHAERDAAKLRRFCEVVGDAVLARRASDVAEQAARATESLSTLARDVYPPHLVEKMEARIMRAGPDLGSESGRRSFDGDESVDGWDRPTSIDLLDATLGGTPGVKADPFAQRTTTELLMDSYSNVTVLFSDGALIGCCVVLQDVCSPAHALHAACSRASHSCGLDQPVVLNVARGVHAAAGPAVAALRHARGCAWRVQGAFVCCRDGARHAACCVP